MINLATVLVIVVLFLGLINFRKLWKTIQIRYDRQCLNDIKKEISVFDEYKKEDKKKTQEKLKTINKMKGKYND